jgi:hypothetical protein
MAAVELQPVDLTQQVEAMAREMVADAVSQARETVAAVEAPALGAVLPSFAALTAAANLGPSVKESARMTPAEIMELQDEEREEDRRRSAKRFVLRSGI